MEDILNKVNQVWLKTNMALFKHVLDYEAKLDAFLNKTGGWIREQEERIWMKVFEIAGDAGAPLCVNLDIMLRLLDTLPSFLANRSYQSNSPIICSFAPEAYAQPWSGLHGMNLACLPSFKSCRKATDILKEAIIQSTGGGAVSRAKAGPWASTSTAPTQIEKDANAPPLTSSSAVHSPSKCRRAKSLLCNTHSLTLLQTRSWHQGTDQEVVVQAHRVHPDQVLSLAVAVDPAKGPQLDLKPAQAQDQPAHEQHRLAASKSFLEMRPVETMMMMPCTLPTRQMCLKAVCPFLISLSLMMRILTNAKHVSLLIKVTPTSWRGKTNSSVTE